MMEKSTHIFHLILHKSVALFWYLCFKKGSFIRNSLSYIYIYIHIYIYIWCHRSILETHDYMDHFLEIINWLHLCVLVRVFNKHHEGLILGPSALVNFEPCIPISALGHHSFRWWHVSCLAPSHYLYQYQFIVIRTLGCPRSLPKPLTIQSLAWVSNYIPQYSVGCNYLSIS